MANKVNINKKAVNIRTAFFMSLSLFVLFFADRPATIFIYKYLTILRKIYQNDALFQYFFRFLTLFTTISIKICSKIIPFQI